MTLWSSTLEKLLSFSINLFARQLYSPQSSHWIQFPSDLQQISVNAIFLRRRWMIWQWEARCTHVVLHRSAKSSAEVQVLADVINAFSLDHSHHTFAFMSPGMFRTPVANGVWVLKWYRDQGKDHVRSNVQAAAATFSNLDWKTKR